MSEASGDSGLPWIGEWQNGAGNRDLILLIDVTFSTLTPYYTQYKKAPTFAVG
jgi:hypothetical protein